MTVRKSVALAIAAVGFGVGFFVGIRGAFATSCTGTTCVATTEVVTAACSGGNCAITQCVQPWFDADGIYSNGCECSNDNYGTVCGGSTSFGTLIAGQTLSKIGILPYANAEKWFAVGFTYNASYHPIVTLTAAPSSPALDSDMVMDINSQTCGTYPNPDGKGFCNSAADATTPVNITRWESNVYPDGNPHLQPTPNFSTVYIRVHRTDAKTSCVPFQINVQL